MSWTHSSRGAILGVLLAISLMAVGTAAALTTSAQPPEPANVNDTVEMTMTVEQPFEGQSNQWTLKGTTELDNATWTIEVYKQGRLIERRGPMKGPLTQELNFNSEDSASRLVINVSGDVPALNEFNYQNMSVENYTVAKLSNEGAGDTIATWRSHRYTTKSLEARQAIDNASAAIEKLESPSKELKNDLDQAISAYNAGNFQNAINIAEEATQKAQTEQKKESGGLPIVLIAGVIVVLLIVVGGGAYYWKSQQQDTSRLQ